MGKAILILEAEKTADGQALIVDGKKIKYLSEKEPKNLPWKNLEIDVVVESSGFFASFEKSKAHLDAGAKRRGDLGAGQRRSGGNCRGNRAFGNQ